MWFPNKIQTFPPYGNKDIIYNLGVEVVKQKWENEKNIETTNKGSHNVQITTPWKSGNFQQP